MQDVRLIAKLRRCSSEYWKREVKIYNHRMAIGGGCLQIVRVTVVVLEIAELKLRGSAYAESHHLLAWLMLRVSYGRMCVSFSVLQRIGSSKRLLPWSVLYATAPHPDWVNDNRNTCVGIPKWCSHIRHWRTSREWCKKPVICIIERLDGPFAGVAPTWKSVLSV